MIMLILLSCLVFMLTASDMARSGHPLLGAATASVAAILVSSLIL